MLSSPLIFTSHQRLTPAKRPIGKAPIPKLILKPSIPKGCNGEEG